VSTVKWTMVEPSIIELRLSRREALSTLTWEVARDFHDALDSVQANDTRVVILTGAGRAFCAGFDRNGFWGPGPARGDGEPWRLLVWVEELSRLVLRLHRLSVPVVVSINGACASAGISIARHPNPAEPGAPYLHYLRSL